MPEVSQEKLRQILGQDAADTIFGLYNRLRRTSGAPEKETPAPPQKATTWIQVSAKPDVFPPAEHTHPYISVETDPTVPGVVKAITEEDIARWNSLRTQVVEIPSCFEPNWVSDTAQDMWDRIENPLCFRWDVMVEEYSTLEHIVSDFVAGSSAVGRMAIWGHKEYGIADTTKLLDEPLFDGHKSSFAPINIAPYIWLTICVDPGVAGVPNPIGQHVFYPSNSAHLVYSYLVEHVHGAEFGSIPPDRISDSPPLGGVVRWMKIGVK